MADAGILPTVTGRTDGLGQTRVAAGHFLGKRHHLPAGDVGETAAIRHQVHIDQFLRHPETGGGLVGDLAAAIVLDSKAGVVIHRKDDLVGAGVIGVEQRQIVRGRISRIVDGIGAGRHQVTRRFGSQVQIVLVVVRGTVGSRVGCGKRGRLTVVLAEGAFKEAELGLEHQGRILVHTVCRLGGLGLAGEVQDRLVDILNHMVEDGLAAVPGRIEVLIGRTDLVVDPRNVPELADHVGIVVGAPELGQRGVFLDGRGILAMVDVGQEGVHLAQVGE